MTTDQLNLAIRDSVAMENAKTFSELDYACRNIEARHRVEGISAEDEAWYDTLKRKHLERVCGGLVA